MAYPLSMELPYPDLGFAVANNKAEEASLKKSGYVASSQQPYVPDETPAPEAPAQPIT